MTDEHDFTPYPHTQGLPDYPKLEEEIQAFWKTEDIFQKSIDNRQAGSDGGEEFVFYDGPPFANGLPHYGHIVTSFVKDIVPRYQTMKGKKVERRFGWDCHGLPAELATEKEINVSGRLEIIDYGIDNFNNACRQNVQQFTEDWEFYVNRMARWVDFKNSYKTMDTSFMESVMWAFKTLHEKGLIYEDYRVVPYSWAVESPLSNFETRLDDSYRMRQDPAVTIAFKLDRDLNGKPTYMLAWTTTPWTLPSNLALAVNKDVEYVLVEKDGNHYVIAKNALMTYEKEFPLARKWNHFTSELFKILNTEADYPSQDQIEKAKSHLEHAPDFVSDKVKQAIVTVIEQAEDDAEFLGTEIETEVGDINGFTDLLETLSSFSNYQEIERNFEASGKIFIRQNPAADATGNTFKGSFFEGMSYEPIFPYFADHKADNKSFKVLLADFVTDTDGTGIAHEAPGFGEDDLYLCRDDYGIQIVVPIDSTGKFTSEVPDYEGMLWLDANKPIMQRLKEEGKLFRQETIDHNYPHCWRTDTPLIYKAINSWYVKVTAFKDRMVELNQGIEWVPAHVKNGSFGKWLENARDWNIGRNRFWGSPVPVWKSDNPDFPRLDVYGSIAELEKDFGVKVNDLHRPEIDNLTRPNPDDPSGKSTMKRVEDVLDCWFESGSMPFAQVHYPFENKDWFDNNFPGDFIVEYIAQTRGWFYTLMVMSTALFDRAPFQNCICHGVVLDENKQKLSKRLKNYPDPVEVFDTYGADALRWYMVSTPLMNGGDLAIPKDAAAIGQVRNQVMNPIWNAYSFYALYANADKVRGEVISDASNVLDQYILAKTRELVERVEAEMDTYRIPEACDHIWKYLDALNNWYIRRSRDRFWGSEKTQDKVDAYNTLYTALVTLCKISSPFLPMLTEQVYKNLTAEESVHLSDWPKAGSLATNPNLVAAMDRVREVCSATLGIRENEKLRVRLPLSNVTVASQDAQTLKPFIDLIKDELNVKNVTLSDDLSQFGKLELKVNPAIGKRVGGAMKDIMPASKQGKWSDNGDGTITIMGHTLSLADNDYAMQLVTGEGTTAQPLSGQGAVILDTTVTPELEAEGLARDLIRAIQNARKEANLHVSDRIRIQLVSEGPEHIIQAAKTHEEFIKSETLSNDLTYGSVSNCEFSTEITLQNSTFSIGFTRQKAAAA